MPQKPTYEDLEKRIKVLEQVELERKMTQEELDQIFSMSLDMISIADINTATFIKVNPAFTETLGYSEEALLEKSFLDFVHPDDLDATIAIIEQKLKSGARVIDFENRYRCKDGSYRWLSWAGHPLIEKGITYSVARDITEWKQNEEELKKSKALLDATGSMARVGGWEFDAQKQEVTWTEETYRIHEVPFDYQPPLREAINFFHPDERGRLEHAIQRALDYGEPYDMEIRFITAKENPLWTRTICKPEIVDGKTVKLFGTFQDITEHKQSMEALEKERGFLSAVLDNIEESIVICDKEGRLTRFNEAAKRLHGIPEQAISPVEWAMHYDLYQKDGQSLLPKEEIPLYRALQGERVVNAEILISPKHGSPRFLVCNGQAFRDASGEINGAVVAMHDITERKKSEEALRESEENYRRLVETANDAIFIAQDGVIKFPNPKTAEVLGYDADELLKTPFADIIHPEDRGLVVARHMQRLKGETPPSNYSFRITNRAGKELWVQLNAVLITWKDRPATINIVRDITEQKQAEEILHKNHEMLKLTEAMANIGSWEWDARNDRTHWSEELFRIFGRDPAEGAPPFAEQSELYANGDIQRLKDAVAICVKQGTPYEIELRAVRPDGEIRHCVSRGQPQYDENGTVFRIAGSFQDITDRKQRDDALRESEEKFRLLFENSIDAHVLYKGDQFIDCNQACIEMLGYSNKEQFLTLYLSEISPPFQKDGKPSREKANEMAALAFEKGSNRFEWLCEKSDGAELFLDVLLTVITIGGEDLIHGVWRNITDLKKLQGQILKTQKMESIGTLAGGVAHDFNNILSSIIGFTELALDEVPNGTSLADNLREVYSAGKRARDLVKQILTFARQSDEKSSPVQPGPIAKEVLKFIRSTIPTTIEIRQNIESDSSIIGNATQVHQVFMNLCTNAAQAMEGSGGILTVSLKDVFLDKKDLLIGMKQGHYIKIEVSDTGVGIAPETIGSIFDPFFTTKVAGEGTGMGLSVVYGIVESYDGIISVDSQLGKGATFTIYLPVTKKRSNHGAYVSEQLPTGTERILFVDDESSITKMGSQILERLGYSVTTRTSSIEALELFKVKPNDFDLVLSDMTMPNLTGDRLAIELMKIKPDIPVILCTGYSKKISDEMASEIGIKAFAYKPMVKADLAKTVRKVLDEAKR